MPRSGIAVRRRRVRTAGWSIVIAVGVSLAVLIGRWTWQGVSATEGDVPSVGQMHFPIGSEVLRSDKECGSGGCTAVFELRPPPDLTATEMLAQYSQRYEDGIPGSLWDIRKIGFEAVADSETVRVAASLWSSSPSLPARR